MLLKKNIEFFKDFENKKFQNENKCFTRIIINVFFVFAKHFKYISKSQQHIAKIYYHIILQEFGI